MSHQYVHIRLGEQRSFTVTVGETGIFKLMAECFERLSATGKETLTSRILSRCSNGSLSVSSQRIERERLR